ncbi:dihydrolipoyl dehydrogenase family protein [Microvirga terricola]|uniref:dihydrolipoyl dehydrogenase family protein n=1 Tax=Microvirga terricola TaxID=2719797 RepID=UPI0031BA9BF9
MTGPIETEVLTPDLCIIGAGAAGLSVAATAVWLLGGSVVLVNKEPMGEVSLKSGCVPSQVLIAAAKRMHEARAARAFSSESTDDDPAVDLPRLRQHAMDVLATLAPMNATARYTAMGVEVIRAEARFLDASTVLAGKKTIKARRFVLATGSRPVVPDLPGLENVACLTDESLFDLADRPDHLVVVGGSASGAELAQAYRRLGVPVTLIEAGARILRHEDPEQAAVIERALRREGVCLKTSAAIERIEPQPTGGLVVHLDGGSTIAGSHLLAATGRRTRTEGLGLEMAGIETDWSGILVNRGFRTTNPLVYAIGSCASGPVAHSVQYEAGLVIRNALFRMPGWLGRTPVPRVVRTDPELAAIGLTETEARAKYRSIRILRWPLSAIDRAQIEGATAGHVKAILTRRGRVLGCSITAPHAGELIMPWALAMVRQLPVSDLARLVYPYPTFSEASKGAAMEFRKRSAPNPWLKRLIGLVRRWG